MDSIYVDCSETLGFESGGCSGGFSKYWKKFTGKKCPFYIACVAHDCEYFVGGGIPIWERLKSDWYLMRDVWRGGVFFPSRKDPSKYIFVPFEYEGGYKPWLGKVWAVPMFLSVRIGGSKFWPTEFRWNYGIDYIDSTLPDCVKDKFRNKSYYIDEQ